VQLTPTTSSCRSNLVSATMPSLKNTPPSRPKTRTQPANPRHTKRPQSHFRTLWDRPPGLSSGGACSPPMSANCPRISVFNIDPPLPQPTSSGFQNDPNPIFRHFVRQASRPVASTVQAANPSYKCGYPRARRIVTTHTFSPRESPASRCQHRDTLGSRRAMLPSRHTVAMPPIRILTISTK